MKNREYLRFPHLLAEVFSHVVMLVSLILAIVLAATSEGEIPTHFNLMGEVDAYGSPWSAISLPVIMFITNLVTGAILRFVPVSSWNTAAKVTEANAPYVYNDTIWTLLVTMVTMSLVALAGTICMFFFRRALGTVVMVVMGIGLAVMTGFIVKTVIDSRKYV